MANLTLTGTNGFQYALKTLWPQSRVKSLVYKSHPFLAMVPKDESFSGENAYIALRYSNPQGRSAQFSVAQANITPNKGIRFNITRVSDYQLVALETEVLLASQSDRGALIRALDTEMEGGMKNISKSLATALYRGRTGVIGQIGTGPSGTSMPLKDINDVTNFEVGMKLVASATTTGARLGSTTVFTVAGVNRDTGVITLNATIDAAWVADSYLFAEGDDANNTAARRKVSGLADWIPASAPSAGEDFFGVDRSVDATRLAGLRFDASLLTPEEAVIRTLVRLAREDGDPSHFFVNHADWQNIVTSLGSKVQTEYMSTGDIGFQSIKVYGPKGSVPVLADQDCPSGRGYALTMDTFKLYSLGPAPRLFDFDGNEMLRIYNADAYEARIGYFAQMYCDAPGYSATVTMPA